MKTVYANSDCREPRVGDWVRFYRNGKLEIGVVNYIRKSNDAIPKIELYTDNGCVHVDAVIEVKR